MQSKISSFKLIDKTLFKKNLKRCWPLYAAYAFVVIWLLPLTMYFDRMMSYYQEEIILNKRISAMIVNDTLPIGLWIAMAMGIFMAMAMFSYLQNERSCSFYHSLPITRETLYSTGFICGAMMMLTSNILAYAIALIVCASFGAECVGLLSLWLLILSLEELFFFSFGCLCMISMGNTIFAGIMYIVFLMIAVILVGPINTLYRYMFMGVTSNLLEIPENWLRIISPYSMFNDINFVSVYAEDTVIGYKPGNLLPGILIEAFIFTVLFIVLGFVFNRIRKSENAGDFIALNFLKPVFRWGLGITTGILLSALMVETLFGSLEYSTTGMVITSLTIIIFAVIGFIAAQMLMKKSFKIFKGIRKELCLFAGIIIIGSIVLIAAGKKMSSYVPEKENVNRVFFEISGFGGEFKGEEEIEEILEIHQIIVDNYDELVNHYKRNDYEGSLFINISEYEENSYTDRSYQIPNTFTEVYNRIIDLINKNGRTMIINNLIADNVSKCDVYFPSDFPRGDEDAYIYLNTTEAKQLHLAVEKDIQEGNLSFWEAAGVFNPKTVYEDDYYVKDGYRTGYIEFEYALNLEDKNGIAFKGYNYKVIMFNTNCTNTIDYLLTLVK